MNGEIPAYVIHNEKLIAGFFGKFRFLSNFFDATVKYEGRVYRNTEAAFQAQKAKNPNVKRIFAQLSAADSKLLGRNIIMRDDWEAIKADQMFWIVLAKFKQNPELAKLLVETGDAVLEERNNWRDFYWGTDENGKGDNQLGKILMLVRANKQVRQNAGI